jgi:hypothetical protein
MISQYYWFVVAGAVFLVSTMAYDFVTSKIDKSQYKDFIYGWLKYVALPVALLVIILLANLGLE